MSRKGSTAAVRSSRRRTVLQPIRQLTVAGAKTVIDGTPTRLATLNAYGLVGTDNAPTSSSGAFTLMPRADVTTVLQAAKATNHNAVRVHSLLMGTDKPGTYLPTPDGSFNETALRQGDFVLAECRRLGLIVLAPAIDRWDYYHGGMLSWAKARLGSSATQADFLNNATTSTVGSSTVNAAGSGGVMDQWFAYLAVLRDRVSTETGATWAQEVQGWESGNEVYDTAFQRMHLRFSAWVKQTIGSSRVVLDGSMATGNRPQSWALQDANTDAAGGHDYDDHHFDRAWRWDDFTAARAAGKAAMELEYDWRDGLQPNPDPNKAHPAVQGITKLREWLKFLRNHAEAAAWWSGLAPGESGHNDGYQVILSGPANSVQQAFVDTITAWNAVFTSTAANPSTNRITARELAVADLVPAGQTVGDATTTISVGASAGTVPTIARTTSGTPTLAALYRLTTTVAVGTNQYWYWFPDTAQANRPAVLAPVTGGRTYTAMAHVRSSISIKAVCRIVFYDKNGSFLSGTDGTAVDTSTSAWTQARVVVAAIPATAAYAAFQVQNGSPHAAATVDAERFGIFAGDVTTWEAPST